MKRNMTAWIQDMISKPAKKPMPILSFPSVQWLNASVLELLSDSDLMADGMRLVAERTDAAASVSFMDLSVEAEAFGAPIGFRKDEVPTVTGRVVEDREGALALAVPEIGAGRTGICIEAIGKAATMIYDRPVLAGMIGPFSLAGRLMDVTEAMILCYEDPDTVHAVLSKTARFLLGYCLALKHAGADGVVIAEPLAGLLSPSLCKEFSSEYIRPIVEAAQDGEFTVLYHNCGRSAAQSIDSILYTGCKAFHFGNAIDMEEMLPGIPCDALVMGNIDPASQFCNGTPDSIRQAVFSLLRRCGGYPNFILSSGCDIPPTASWDHIDAFFAAVQQYYRSL